MSTQQPLEGIRIIDLTRILSGPFCTMILGDMGAEVIKIEGPGGGDPIRTIGEGAHGLSWYFASFNRNKKSVVIDLKSEQGKQQLATLLRDADVLVENFRPGVLARMGFSEPELQALNPRLVVTSINGYGSQGPYVDRPAFDFIIQAMSGFMSVNGDPQGPAFRSGLPITDLVAGLYAAFGVVCALRARDLNGQGQTVESPMLTGIMSMFAYLASNCLATGTNPERVGNDHPIASPYGLFETADGAIAIAPSTPKALNNLLKALDLEHLLDDDRFKTNDLRVQHRQEINELIENVLRNNTRKYWVNYLNDSGVPCGLVQSVKDALADEQVLAQDMVIDVDHGERGCVRMLGFPLKLSGTPCRVRYPAPRYGEHTDQVLSDARAKPRAVKETS